MRVRIVEMHTGYWRAHLEGEEAGEIVDRSPDQALAGWIRANMRRLGIEQIAYASEAEGAPDASLKPSPGRKVFPPAAGLAPVSEREEGG